MRELTPDEIRQSEDDRRAPANAEYERLVAEAAAKAEPEYRPVH